MCFASLAVQRRRVGAQHHRRATRARGSMGHGMTRGRRERRRIGMRLGGSGDAGMYSVSTFRSGRLS